MKENPEFGSPQHREALRKAAETIASGYSGIMPNGSVVDRRERPEAIPIQKNSLLGTPEPKEVV